MINKRLKDALFSDQWSELCMDTLSPFGYVLVSTVVSNHSRCISLTDNLVFLYISPFRWHPSACRECCCWFSPNSAIFRSSEVCRRRAHAPDSEVTGYVRRIEERQGDVRRHIHVCVNVGFRGRGGVLRGVVCACVSPCPLVCAWVYMSVCDLPMSVDVSITPGWCSLLLFEVSAAASCLALWFCDSGARQTS